MNFDDMLERVFREKNSLLFKISLIAKNSAYTVCDRPSFVSHQDWKSKKRCLENRRLAQSSYRKIDRPLGQRYVERLLLSSSTSFVAKLSNNSLTMLLLMAEVYIFILISLNVIWKCEHNSAESFTFFNLINILKSNHCISGRWAQ